MLLHVGSVCFGFMSTHNQHRHISERSEPEPIWTNADTWDKFRDLVIVQVQVSKYQNSGVGGPNDNIIQVH